MQKKSGQLEQNEQPGGLRGGAREGLGGCNIPQDSDAQQKEKEQIEN